MPTAEPESELETPAELLDPDSATKGAKLLSAERLAKKPRSEWQLLKIDPKSGRRLATFVLPSSSISKLLPGDREWAIIEGSSAPNLKGESSTYLQRFPAAWLAARDGATHPLVCAQP